MPSATTHRKKLATPELLEDILLENNRLLKECLLTLKSMDDKLRKLTIAGY
jgi:hypothetical protein